MTVYGKPVAAVIVTLGLAACGGGSPQPATPPPAPKPAACQTDAASQACVDERKAALDAAEAALEAARDDPNSTQKQIADARKAYDAARKAHGAAVSARNARLAAQPPVYGSLAAMAKAIGSPGTLPAALTANDGSGASAVRGGEVTVGTPNAYSEAAWPAPAAAGWTGRVWEKEDAAAGTADSVVVYTNVEAKRSGAYSDYFPAGATQDEQHPPDSAAAASGFSWVPWIAAVTDVGNDDDRVITLSNETLGAGDHEKIDFPGLPTTANGAQNFMDDATTAGVDERKVKGTFYGVAGTFACAGDGVTCTATNDAKGNLAALTASDGGNWTFTPDETGAAVADVQTDADYLDFGYWVGTSAGDGGGAAYAVDAFARGRVPSADSDDDVSTLEGSATYEGAAAGLYVRRALSASGDGAVEAAGRFTADAELTARFGGNDVALNDQYSISGRIGNFMDGGKPVDAAWSLELRKIQGEFFDSFDAPGAFTGGAATGGGSWSGAFYGPVDDDTDGQADGNQSLLPSGVAGEFTGGWNNGSVVGAFGAAKTGK